MFKVVIKDFFIDRDLILRDVWWICIDDDIGYREKEGREMEFKKE